MNARKKAATAGVSFTKRQWRALVARTFGIPNRMLITGTPTEQVRVLRKIRNHPILQRLAKARAK